MARKLAATLHLMTVREVQAAADGDRADGGGLLLRVRGDSASWVLRYTAPSGRRREMGLGVARRNNSAQTGDSLTTARKLAHEARELLQRGADPIDERDGKRDGARQATAAIKAGKALQQMTLARAARDYHERVIEPTRTTTHAAQWVSSQENHMPATMSGRCDNPPHCFRGSSSTAMAALGPVSGPIESGWISNRRAVRD